MHRSIFIALAALAAGTVAAEEARLPDPTDPRAKVPGVEYRSAFESYRPFAEEKLTPWRQSNEAVKGDAGHGAPAAMESGTPKQADTPKPVAKPSGAPEHGGHR